MLSEQGGFLALSNRDEVTSYVEKAYRSNVVSINEFTISGGYKIKKAYVVAQRPEGTPETPRRQRTPVQDDASMSMGVA